MTDSINHKRTLRQEFTKQADSYANSSKVTDPERVDYLVEISGVRPDARVLEIGTGPGHVAMGFAQHSGEVVGLDLTAEPLQIAQEKKRERDQENLVLVQADAEDVPFEDHSFDVVCCRLALHHTERPERILEEIARVCRSSGYVVVEDLVVSEHSERAAFQNQVERLRDPSHVRALPISELLQLVAEAGLDAELVETNELLRNVDEWLKIAKTPENRATEVREMVREDAKEDLSGMQPFMRNDSLQFIHRTVAVVARNLD
jgi:ubiquinone/menaquinone biosynthesis C-methylase UbiE